MAFPAEYKRLMKIGEGGFARIYKVRHKEFGYIRAVKISKEVIDDENDKAYKAFMNECKLLLQIGNGSHPSIVHIYTPRIVDGQAVVEMDYVEGETITDFVRTHRFVNMKEFRRFAEDITGALAYCHFDLYKFRMDPEEDDLECDPDDASRYIISSEKEKALRRKYCICHNDLHSNNIMRRNYDGHYILLDFGLAIQDGNCVRSSARQDGATEYCSPEKLDCGDFKGTPMSDVYSFGVVMYEMLTGRVPFPLKSSSLADTSRVIDAHINNAPEPISTLRRQAFEAAHPGEEYIDDMPEGLEAIVMKCLAKRPTDRYADGRELKADLDMVWLNASHIASSSVETEELISQLNKEIETLRAENKRLREGAALSPAADSSYFIGEQLTEGIVGSIDLSGNHGILIARNSLTPMKRLMMVEEGDFDRFGAESQKWYSENCFIVPRLTHLPSLREVKQLGINAGQLGLDSPVWATDDSGYIIAADPLTGLPTGDETAQFISVRAF